MKQKCNVCEEEHEENKMFARENCGETFFLCSDCELLMKTYGG